MSENNQVENSSAEAATKGAQLQGLYAFKEGMATVFNEKGEAVSVTVLRFDNWVVSQIKTNENDGYTAVQIAALPKKSKNVKKSEIGHMKKAGLEGGMAAVHEVRQEDVANIKVGDAVSINSFKKGDDVKLTATSKGKGFAGSVKRWGFAGGPASHGSKFHRRPGSSGNRTWPGRVMPGKKFPGHLGDRAVTVKSVKVYDVMSSEGVLLVEGPVPGARNSLVKMVKV